METNFLRSIQQTIKHWYIPLLVGLFFIIVSVIVFASPQSSLLTLSILFALSFLFGGLSEIIFSVVNRRQMENWGWSLAFGIITFIVGFMLLIQPGLSLGVLAFYIGFTILFRSVAAISFALDLKKFRVKYWGALLTLGILGIVISFILIWNPVFSGLSVVMLIAIGFLSAGLFSIVLALQLRKLHKWPKKVSKKLRERYDEIIEEIRDEIYD